MIGIPAEQEQTQNRLQAIRPWNRIMQGNDKHKQNSSGGQAVNDTKKINHILHDRTH
jgi:hypothetical protein